MLDRANPLIIQSSPLIHVQSVKDGTDGSTGGGFSSTSISTASDLTYVNFNSIPNATLTVSGSTSGTPKTFPDTSLTASIINNPNASTHYNLCYVTVPEGTYSAEWIVVGNAATYLHSGLYDLTNSEWISYPYASSQLPSQVDGNATFTTTGTTNIEVRLSPMRSANVPATYDHGYPSYIASAEKAADIDLKIYKIG
jgi:hypothetical protein